MTVEQPHKIVNKQKVMQISYSKPIIAVTALLVVMLTGCQTVPANDVGNISYKTSTQPNNIRNLDKQEIARVRTSLAAQYIRKNELDTAQQQLEKAFAANSRYAPAYDMMGVLLQQEGSRLNLEKADGYFKKAIELDAEFT